jgi:DNA-binding NtrC family response regulator
VIIGEIGTGKSLLASHIHRKSPLSSKALQSINFDILPEREQRGALLGGGPPDMPTTRRSLLEIPSTLILKHIDKASPYLQEKLAEALVTRRLERLGCKSIQFVHARLVFTLRSRIKDFCRGGRLIHPLFTYLSQCEQLSIPPLRKHKSDIPPLATHFFNTFVNRYPGTSTGHPPIILGRSRDGKLEPALTKLLLKQPWPENVLGLKAYVRSLVVGNYRDALDESERREVMKMIMLIEEGHEFSLHDAIALIQQSITSQACTRCDGKQSKAAVMLGVSDRTVRRALLSRR